MSTTAPPAPPRKRLPRTFVACCLALGVLVGAYTVVTLLSLTTASVERRTRVLRAPPAGALRIDSGSSDVSVVGERRRGVRVDMAIQRGMWRGGWQPRVAVERDGRRLELQSHCSVWAHIGVGDCGASFTVRVPRGTRLAVDAGSGDVRVAGLARGATVDTSSGDVHAQDVAGPLRVLASAGDVDVEGYRGADVTLQAGSGDVELDARSAPRRVRATTGPGDVALEVPDRAYRVAVRTGTGDRSVHVREDPHAPRSIVATTGAGDVSVAAPGR